MPNGHVHESRPRRQIAMLAFDGSEILDICGPLDAFYYADRWLRELGRVSEPVYPARILGPAAGPIVTSSGMRIMVDQGSAMWTWKSTPYSSPEARSTQRATIQLCWPG
jgi:hypothetical protein